MPDFKAFEHFQHLATLQGDTGHNQLVTLDSLIQVVSQTGLLTKTPSNIKSLQRILELYDDDEDGKWTYSEYLKFVYSSIQQLLQYVNEPKR
jgi:Ca2+-binding EF-hand superfamily protein